MPDLIPVGFTVSDFFYNNVTAPTVIKIDNSGSHMCDISDNVLKERIKVYFNDLSYNPVGKQPIINNKAGQCIIETATSGSKDTANNWTMVYTKDSKGNQICSCTRPTGVTPYISESALSFNTLNSASSTTTKYTCKNSTNSSMIDIGFSEISLDEKEKGDLINKTFEFYKMVCENQNLVVKLQDSISKNLNGDLKLDDSINKYNREYLNRINLGIGIIFICGFISYCITTKPGSLPQVKIPQVKIPEMKMPEMKIPEMKIPQVNIPSVNSLPKK